MNYVIAPNDVYQYTVAGGTPVVWDDSHYCSPDRLTLEEQTQFSVYPLIEVDWPEFSELTHYVTETTPLLINGNWMQQWSIQEHTQEQKAALAEEHESSRIASLWQAAHDKEYEAISGSAIGLIVMGVLQGKPKCAAVQNWIKALWSEYYIRKASGSSNSDFSIVGECPHSVPELMSELNI